MDVERRERGAANGFAVEPGGRLQASLCKETSNVDYNLPQSVGPTVDISKASEGSRNGGGSCGFLEEWTAVAKQTEKGRKTSFSFSGNQEEKEEGWRVSGK